MRVAIIGTGKMGGAMARRLKSQGHALTLWNRTRERAEALGVGKVASTPADAAQDAEVVISILSDADAVRAAYLGEGGAAHVARDQVFVEMSTAGPDVSTELYKKSGATTPLAMATKELYELAAQSAGDLDMSAIATLYENHSARRD